MTELYPITRRLVDRYLPDGWMPDLVKKQGERVNRSLTILGGGYLWVSGRCIDGAGVDYVEDRQI